MAAQAFRQLAGGLEALKVDPPLRLRPTLTMQTPSGLVLGWINDLIEGRKEPPWRGSIEGSSSPGRLARAWDLLLAGRPLVPLGRGLADDRRPHDELS